MPDQKPKTIRVRMAPGLSMPLPSGIGVDTTVTVMTPETPVDVLLDSRFVRRRLEMGDFVLVDDAVPEAVPAVAPPPPLPPPPDLGAGIVTSARNRKDKE